MSRHRPRIATLSDALTSTDEDWTLTTSTADFLAGQMEARTWTCRCCRGWVQAALANIDRYLNTPVTEWKHVTEQPKPPMPAHLYAHLTNGAP